MRDQLPACGERANHNMLENIGLDPTISDQIPRLIQVVDSL